jgi:hypothetical protein
MISNVALATPCAPQALLGIAEAGLELIELDYAQNGLGKAAELANALRQWGRKNVDILYIAHRIYSERAGETTLTLAMVAPDSARMEQLMAHEQPGAYTSE